MAQTFHSFLLLPWELRNQIWEYALRPDRPGVHIFRVSGRSCQYDENDEPILNAYDVAVPPIGPWDRLSAPELHPAHAVARNQTDGGANDGTASPLTRWSYNPSTYLVDGGLWTACKESRLVMERRFRTREWDAVVKESRRRTDPYRPWTADNLPTPYISMPATGYFRPDESSPSDVRFFTVLPHQDLIIFQPEDDKTFVEVWPISVPFDSTELGFQGMKYAAVEYNPAWDAEPLDIVETMVKCALEMTWMDTIWLVDRRLKRDVERTKGLDDEADVSVFYDEGGRYIQMLQGRPWAMQDGWNWSDGVASGSFIDAVESECCDIMDDLDEFDTNRGAAFEILAYEPY